jgi:hypothetical protein
VPVATVISALAVSIRFLLPIASVGFQLVARPALFHRATGLTLRVIIWLNRVGLALPLVTRFVSLGPPGKFLLPLDFVHLFRTFSKYTFALQLRFGEDGGLVRCVDILALQGVWHVGGARGRFLVTAVF